MQTSPRRQANPALPRVIFEGPAEPIDSKPIKRCLFERDENTLFEMQALIDRQAAEQSVKWNFDFRTGQPMEGRFEWIKIQK